MQIDLRQPDSTEPSPRNRLVSQNLAFVVQVAQHFRRCGIPLEDLVAEGNLGLIEAAERFDPARGTRFITFAVWWVRKAMLEAIEQRSTVVRIPAYHRRRMIQIRRTETELRARFHRAPMRQEISDALSEKNVEIDRTLSTHHFESSIDDAHVGSSEFRVEDRLTDPAAVDPETRVIREEFRLAVQAAIDRLTATEREVIEKRYGLAGDEPQLLRQVGQDLGLSRERVRQIERTALERLARIVKNGRTRLRRPPTPVS